MDSQIVKSSKNKIYLPFYVCSDVEAVRGLSLRHGQGKQHIDYV